SSDCQERRTFAILDERWWRVVERRGVEGISKLLRPLDATFPIERQLGIDAAPVVLVNVFTLDKADEQTFLKAWQHPRRESPSSIQASTRCRRSNSLRVRRTSRFSASTCATASG